MGERKVINKYIPADFDPSLIPKGTKLSKKDGTVPVRMMLPFSIQCSTCHTFMYRGRKFNSKKEAMGGPDGRYLGIQRWRFYIKCTHCSRTISFLTDPKNADYEMESGGTRNYEVYKDKEKTEEQSLLEKEEEETKDPMKALENRVLDSQREMADLDNLEEIKAMNKRHVQLLNATGQDFDANAKALLEAREERLKMNKNNININSNELSKEEELNEHGITQEEENMIKTIKFGKKSLQGGRSGMGVLVRLNEQDEQKEEEKRKRELEVLQQRQLELDQKASSSSTSLSNKQAVPLIKVVKRKKVVANNNNNNNNGNENGTGKRPKVETPKEPAPTRTTPQPAQGLAGLLGGYGSDDSSDSD